MICHLSLLFSLSSTAVKAVAVSPGGTKVGRVTQTLLLLCEAQGNMEDASITFTWMKGDEVVQTSVKDTVSGRASSELKIENLSVDEYHEETIQCHPNNSFGGANFTEFLISVELFPPPVIVSFRFDPDNPDMVIASWNPVNLTHYPDASLDGYYIEVSRDGNDNDIVSMGTAAGNDTSFVLSVGEYSDKYWVRIKAVKGNLDVSSFSGWFQVDPFLPLLPPPVTVSFRFVSDRPDMVNVTWLPVSLDGYPGVSLDGYYIEVSRDGNDSDIAAMETAGISDTSFVLSVGEYSNNYWVRIKAVKDDVDVSIFSGWFQVDPLPPPLPPPVIVSFRFTSDGPDMVNVTWDPVSLDGYPGVSLDRYYIEVSRDRNDSDIAVMGTVAGSDTSFVLSVSEYSNNYWVRIKAVKGDLDVSSFSGWFQVDSQAPPLPPPVIVNFRFTSDGPDMVTVTWDPVSLDGYPGVSLDGYYIEVSRDRNENDIVAMETAGISDTSFVLSVSEYSNNYWVRIKAVKGNLDVSSFSGWFQVDPLPPPLPPPVIVSFRFTSDGPDMVNVTWLTVSLDGYPGVSLDRYYIEVSRDRNGSDIVAMETVGISDTSFVLSVGEYSNNYWVRIKAVKGNLDVSSFSGWFQVESQAPPLPPLVIVNFRFTSDGPDMVNVTWDPVSLDGYPGVSLDGYYIEVSRDRNENDIVAMETAGISDTSFVLSVSEYSNNYWVRIKAVKGNLDVSSFSGWFQVDPLPPPLPPPVIVSFRFTSDGPDMVNVTWLTVSLDGYPGVSLDRYYIEVSRDRNGSDIVAMETAGISDTSFVLSVGEYSNNYWVRIKAVKGNLDVSSFSGWFQVESQAPPLPPPVIVNFRFTSDGPDMVNVTWDPVSLDGYPGVSLDGYYIEVSRDRNENDIVAMETAGISDTSFVLSVSEYSNNYWVRIKAVKGNLDVSSFSGWFQVDSQAPPLPPPVIVNFRFTSDGPDMVNVTWDPVSLDGYPGVSLDGYYIEVSRDRNDSDIVAMETAGISDTSFVLSASEYSNNYWVRIKAVKGNLDVSSFSGWFQVDPLPPPLPPPVIVSFRFTSDGPDMVTVTWDPVSLDGYPGVSLDRYYIEVSRDRNGSDIVAMETAGISDTSFVLSVGEYSNNYWVRIKAVKGNLDVSSFSGWFQVDSQAPPLPPPVIVNFRFTSDGPDMVNVTWDPVSLDGYPGVSLDGYYIEVSRDRNDSDIVAMETAGISDTSFVLSVSEYSNNYWVRIKAVKGNLDVSSFSGWFQVDSQAPPLPPPVIVNFRFTFDGPDMVNVTWDPVSLDGYPGVSLDGYYIEVSRDRNDSDIVAMETAGISDTSFVLSVSEYSNNYWVRIKAVKDNLDVSSFSGWFQVDSLPTTQGMCVCQLTLHVSKCYASWYNLYTFLLTTQLEGGNRRKRTTTWRPNLQPTL